jgi:membrane glycosyltransferase
MKNLLITIGIFMVVGVILGVLAYFLNPAFTGWQLSVLISVTIILTTIANRLIMKINKK